MSEHGLSNERLIWMLTQMLRIREFEERVKGTFEEHPGVIRGHTHLADGAEASIVGALAALGPDDQILATYRCHGYPIALGTDTKAMMAEIYGREGRALRRLRRLDAPRRRVARLPRHVGHRRRRASRTRPARPTPRRSAGKGQVVLSASSATARRSRARSTSR